MREIRQDGAMGITRLCVAGAGIMGSGIAQVAAMSGFRVTLYDVSPLQLQAGCEGIRARLGAAVSAGKLSPDSASESLSRLGAKRDMEEAVSGVELVIEAVVESLPVKMDLFRAIDSLCEVSAIFATNTSALSITQLASSTNRADRFIGMHFFNPAPVMKLVEITRGYLTSDATISECRAVVVTMGKTAIEINEAPGFAVNRILCPMINEAVFALSEGVATAADIDKAMVLGANHPMGPLRLADMVGIDTLLAVLDGLHAEFGEDKYRPAPLLRKMVRAGRLGRKSGIGFFDYSVSKD